MHPFLPPLKSGTETAVGLQSWVNLTTISPEMPINARFPTVRSKLESHNVYLIGEHDFCTGWTGLENPGQP